MRKLLSFLIFLSALPVLEAVPTEQLDCDVLMKQYVGFPSELVPVLASAKDGSSAEAAAPQLEALLPRLFALREQIKKLPVPDAETAKALENAYGLQMRMKWGEVFQEIYRLQAAACFHSENFQKSFTTMCLILR